jgi:hypothetical protein
MPPNQKLRNVTENRTAHQGLNPESPRHYDQADALLAAAESRPLYAYIVVSLLTGARTEELRALTWSHVDLDASPPVIMVWRSVRTGGDTSLDDSGVGRGWLLNVRCRFSAGMGCSCGCGG